MVDVAQLVESRIVIPAVAGSNPVVHPIFRYGPLAQLVEQETLNLLVEGSTPSRPTKFTATRLLYVQNQSPGDCRNDAGERVGAGVAERGN
jgi:hypothetical protein